MIKKINLFFFVIFLIFAFFVSARAQNTTINSIDKLEKTASGLNNTEKMPSAEDISTIASTIRNIAETYQSIKSKIISTIGYCKNLIKSAKETREKIESGGSKIKKYIEDKIGIILKITEINLFLINHYE